MAANPNPNLNGNPNGAWQPRPAPDLSATSATRGQLHTELHRTQELVDDKLRLYLLKPKKQVRNLFDKHKYRKKVFLYDYSNKMKI